VLADPSWIFQEHWGEIRLRTILLRECIVLWLETRRGRRQLDSCEGIEVDRFELVEARRSLDSEESGLMIF
jgi:hypothetical protein